MQNRISVSGSQPMASDYHLAGGGYFSPCRCRRMASVAALDLCLTISRLGLTIVGLRSMLLPSSASLSAGAFRLRPVWPGIQFVVILLPLERIFCYVVSISQEVDVVFGHAMLWTVDI